MEDEILESEFAEEVKKMDKDVETVVDTVIQLPEIPKQTGSIVKPIDVEGTLEAFKMFQDIKTRLLSVNDFMKFGTDGKPTHDKDGKGYIKKEGWLKIKTAFGISISLGKPYRTDGEDSDGYYYLWTVPVRATAPNGQYHEAYGACSSRKPFFSKKHGEKINPKEEDILLTAQTVGINRAVSGLVGGGELSAEEMAGTSDSTESAPAPTRALNIERKTFNANQQELNPETYRIAAPNSKWNGHTYLETPASYIQWSIECMQEGKTMKNGKFYKLDMTKFGYNNSDFLEFLQCCYRIRLVYEEEKSKPKGE